MRLFHAFVISALLSLTVAPLVAADGVLITQKTTMGTAVRTSRLQIEKDRMRSDTETTTGEKQVVIFDGPKQVLTVIYPDRKAYTEMTKADIDRMNTVPVTMSPEMKAQIEKMPPSQRSLMEAVMRGRGTATPVQPPKMEYRKAGSDKVGKWACDKYDGFQNNVKKMTICTVPPATLGVAMTDFDITKQMAAFFGRIAPQGSGATLEVGTPESLGFSGVPVRTIGYGSNGEVLFTSELSDVAHQNFAASSYAVPAGFQKQATFGGRGQAPAPAPR